MRIKTCAVFLLAVLLMSAPLLAFNGQRKGFILGGGVGAGYLSYQERFDGEGPFDLNKFSLATNFKIGYAPSNSLEIYYINSVSWFGYMSETLLIGVTGAGVTKYLSPKGTGFFVSLGAGISFFRSLTAGGGSFTGFGLIGGIGYEFSKHWSIQGDVLYTTMESNQIRSLSVRATVNFLAF
jgi:hypothetical protein